MDAVPAPFPAASKSVKGAIGSIATDVTILHFADKILLTIAQEGRLAQWVHVPLESSGPKPGEGRSTMYIDEDDDEQGDLPDGPSLYPMSHLTASVVLGASSSDRDTVAQLFATQIASAILIQHPEESRLLVVGLGLAKSLLDSSTDTPLIGELLQLVLQIV